MNQSFAFDLTPGVCRRLLQIQKVAKIELDQIIADLAKQDTVVDDDKLKRNIKQFIIDCGFRCVVKSPNESINRSLILETLESNNLKPFIATDKSREWKKLLDKSSRKYIMPVTAAADIQNQKSFRDHVLILDNMCSGEARKLMMTGLCKEFEKVVIFIEHSETPQTKFDLAEWSYMAEVLFPVMFVNDPNISRFKSAIFYNVFIADKMADYIPE